MSRAFAVPPPGRRTALVTGAASGIGRATALRFARGGFCVVAADVDDDGLATLAALAPPRAASGTGGEVRTAHLDVTDADAWARVVAEARGIADRLDVLVNNAGLLVAGAFAETPVAAHAAVLDVNTRGVLLGCHASFEALAATPGSHLVNLASASAVYGQAGLATYAATKSFVRSLTEGLRTEWAPHGVAVADVWPLFVQTAMVDAIGPGTAMDVLGVRLTPDDVSATVWRAAHSRGPVGVRVLARTHHLVGGSTKATAMAARLSPEVVTRAINRVIGGSGLPEPAGTGAAGRAQGARAAS